MFDEHAEFKERHFGNEKEKRESILVRYITEISSESGDCAVDQRNNNYNVGLFSGISFVSFI